MTSHDPIRVHCRAGDKSTDYALKPANLQGLGGNYVWTVKPTTFSPGNPRALDLLEVARAVHMADRAFRRSMRLGQRRRRIRVHVPVSDPELWGEHAARLAGLAELASEDDWKLDFVPRRGQAPPARSSETQRDSSVVALFSGGLDSLCGAAHLAASEARPVFLHHSPPGRESVVGLVGDLWKSLTEDELAAERCVTCRLRLVERDDQGARSMFPEPTRRTRPFFFLGLAAAVAVELGIPRIQMSENGAMALSLPIRADAYGALRSRQAHRALLDGYRELLARIAPEMGEWAVENPLETETKGEACHRLVGRDELASRSVSCEYVGRQAAVVRAWRKKHPEHARNLGEGPQCGICEPCLCRRAALAHAEIPDPDGGYFFDARAVGRWLEAPGGTPLEDGSESRPPLLGVVAPHVAYMRRFCDRLLASSELDFGVSYLPELRSPGSANQLEARWLSKRFALMQRFAREMLSFLDS